MGEQGCWHRRSLRGGDQCDAGEQGQSLVLLLILVIVVLMVLALGFDTSNWFLGRRALGNLADGAALAAANDIDTRAYYRSGGQEVRVLDQRARQTVLRYVNDASGSGLDRLSVRSVTTSGTHRNVSVTVQLQASTPGGFMRLIRVVPPAMEGSATATARVLPPR